MTCCSLLLALSAVLHVSAELVAPNALNLQLTSNLTHEIPSTIYGFMWEDINHSGDGGLYGELLQNRAFQAVIPGTQNALNAWQPVSGARLSVTSKTEGVSDSLPNSLEVKIPKVVFGPVGFLNTGYWGIKVQEGWTYKGSLYAKAKSFTGTITVALRSSAGATYASAELKGISSEWNKFTFEFDVNKSAKDVNNVFSVTVDGSEAAGKTIHFGLFSLFPPTFRGRENGMRLDLAEAMAATLPSVWRFPGGNNLEGTSFSARWKWNETIGPLEDRPGRAADWSYSNTDGLGLLEYLNWAEDLGAEPILGVWDGISISNYSDLTTWPIVPEADLQPYIDDVLNEIEFIIGDASTTYWGGVRASFGREAPYEVKMIEIGNEDQFEPESYAGYRWASFVNAIEEKYPGHFQFIATSYPQTALDPAYLKIDFHQYADLTWFENAAFMFDDYPRNGTQYFVGEYAVTSTNPEVFLGDIPSGRLAYPTLEGAAAEAAFMTGMERNSDVVFASAYAPTLQHIKNYQWTPDILTFDAGSFVKSTSYYVQQMFSVNRGTHVLQTIPTSTNDTAPLYWVASFNNETDVVFLKVSNTGHSDLAVYITYDFMTTNLGTASSLSLPALSPISGLFNTSNTLEAPDLLTPVHTSFAIPEAHRLNYTFPATSITVIALQMVI